MTTPAWLTPNLITRQSAYFATNSGAFVSAGEALLVDPNLTPAEIDALGDAVRAAGAAPRRLLLTHSHWDHILGPERFAGVPILAHARYPATVAEARPAILRELEHWRAQHGGPPRATPFEVPLPDETVAGEAEVALGALRLRLIPVPGHAPDQLAVYEPETGCLWAADILSDLEIPFVADSLPDYAATLKRLEQLNLRALVPGHGSPTRDPAEIQTRLDEDRAYLAELDERLGRAAEQGLGLDEAVALCATMPYRRPDLNADAHRMNVESAYAALSGAFDPAQVGWGAA
jgi:glyoxylase-like metal-dependent hydrolase (beta-lactamase superfamily II)